MFSAPSMLMFKHPPRPLKRHTISKCCAIFSRNPFPSHPFHISCRPHRPTQHLVLQLPGQENCIFGRCHQLAQASKHHPRTSQRTRVVWTSGGRKNNRFIPKGSSNHGHYLHVYFGNKVLSKIHMLSNKIKMNASKAF